MISEAAIRRRVKRELKNKELEYFATCTPGFEQILSEEIRNLGSVENIEIEKGGVSFSGRLDVIYHFHLSVLTAEKLLLRIVSFKVKSYPELFDRLTRVNWPVYTGAQPVLSIEASARRSKLHHTTRISETLEAAVLKFYGSEAAEQTVSSEQRPAKLQLRLFRDEATVSLNLSGEPLYRRSYKILSAAAPLRETVASALLQAAGAEYEKCISIADLFCGSGTFLSEFLLLKNRGVQTLFRNYDFQYAPFYQSSYFKRLQQYVLSAPKEKNDGLVQVFGSDLSENALAESRQNLTALNNIVDFAYSLEQADFQKAFVPFEPGIITANLPYNKRIKSEAGLSRRYLSFLQKNYQNSRQVTLCSDESLNRCKGHIRFKNGAVSVQAYTGPIG